MIPSRKSAFRAFLTTASLVLLSACADPATYPQTTFAPISEYGRLLNRLFANTFWWTIGIMVLVEILLIVFVIKYRARPGAPQPKQIHGHTGLEITWTLIPAVIVLFIVVPTVGGIFATQAKADESALQVEVIGHQWWWEFRYPQLGITTANELVIPAGRQVQLKMWSADVIHSFWIPRIGGKRDVNPQPRTVKDERAKYNYIVFNAEQPGYYLGQCAEFCGASHAIMRTAALVVNESEFDRWASSMGGTTPVRQVNPAQEREHGETAAEKIPGTEPGSREGGILGPPRDTLDTRDTLRAASSAAPQAAAAPSPQMQAPSGMSPTGAPAPGRPGFQGAGPTPPGMGTLAAAGGEPLAQRGEQLFTTRVCVACHTIKGTTAQGKLGPDLTRFGARRYVGAGAAKATQENVERWIERPQDMKPGALMPGATEGGGGMPATGLTNDEVRAIAAYLKSLN